MYKITTPAGAEVCICPSLQMVGIVLDLRRGANERLAHELSEEGNEAVLHGNTRKYFGIYAQLTVTRMKPLSW